jgi:hypothetical protein
MTDIASQLTVAFDKFKGLWNRSEISNKAGLVIVVISVFLIIVNLLSLILEQVGIITPAKNDAEAVSPQAVGRAASKNSEEAKKQK